MGNTKRFASFGHRPQPVGEGKRDDGRVVGAVYRRAKTADKIRVEGRTYVVVAASTVRSQAVTRPHVELRPCLGAEEYPTLVRIWRSAIDATHGFVRPEHLARIEDRLPREFLPAVNLTVALVDGRPVGFAGVTADKLEMLFVDDDFRGKGIGTVLLNAARQRDPHLLVDVNEQNTQAVDFYRRRGFASIGRSAVDGDGLPYPLLHLQISSPS
ncbi:putative N-acetyltransferase YjaB [Mycobacterium basiliense]|uniref:Putative N-acetyltransferase YjaB n=1 Tax=Mycobacterium basiliense TaxID=2094119 RepID=A0A447GIC3_9MYCO|nr:putative N-acetyltransferase YjaB [Mycobacterium basiliense]